MVIGVNAEMQITYWTGDKQNRQFSRVWRIDKHYINRNCLVKGYDNGKFKRVKVLSSSQANQTNILYRIQVGARVLKATEGVKLLTTDGWIAVCDMCGIDKPSYKIITEKGDLDVVSAKVLTLPFPITTFFLETESGNFVINGFTLKAGELT